MLQRVAGGWVEVDPDENSRRFKVGSIYRAEIAEMRNGPFFRKWWFLCRVVYGLWQERMPAKEINGIQVVTSFDIFRKDLTVLAGYYVATYGIDGSVRLEAQSLKWSQMNEETFHQLYSNFIDASLHKVLPGLGFTAEKLDAWALKLLEAAR